MSLQCFTHDDTKLLCMGMIPYICGLLALILQNTLLDLVPPPSGLMVPCTIPRFQTHSCCRLQELIFEKNLAAQ